MNENLTVMKTHEEKDKLIQKGWGDKLQVTSG